MSNIALKKQNYFQQITAAEDLEALYHSVIASKAQLQIKEENLRSAEENALTLLTPYNSVKGIMLAKHASGPHLLAQSQATVMIDLAGTKYFCSARVIEVKGVEYVVSLDKVFRLQRRNTFRVKIPEKPISAKFNVMGVNETARSDSLRVLDLSAGGFGLHVSPHGLIFYEAGALIVGTLRVGAHPDLELSARIKFRRKQLEPNRHLYYHVGCEFVGLKPAQTHLLSFIVNDCHRVIFSRIKG